MPSEKMKQRIEAFKKQVKCANEKGLEIRPSVDGPYAYDPIAAIVVGRKGSAAYALAVSESAQLLGQGSVPQGWYGKAR